MAANMSIDTKPVPPPANHQDESGDESISSSPIADLDRSSLTSAAGPNPAAAAAAAQDGQQPKRKGGRKPVCLCFFILDMHTMGLNPRLHTYSPTGYIIRVHMANTLRPRSTPPPRSESSGTARPRPPSASVAPSTSSSSRTPSASTSPTSTTSRRPIAPPPTSV